MIENRESMQKLRFRGSGFRGSGFKGSKVDDPV
jgi:hypothetical protein